MAGEFLVTVGEAGQLANILNGRFLRGRAEPRIAMVGRSNVGKSSLINALMGGKLARVSAEPGKTRHLHFYLWKDEKRVIADLPGYGFARASHADRDQWAAFIEAYFRADEGLERALVLLDARHGPTDTDLDAIGFLSSLGIPVTFIFSKSDTLRTQSERVRRKREAEQALRGLSDQPPLWISSKTKDGLNALLQMVRNGPAAN